MHDAANHLVTNIIPDVPVRQWVLSPPFDLRGLLACRGEVMSKLGQVFVGEVFRRAKAGAKAQGHEEPQCGAITVIQRFSKTLVISPHLHSIVLDGVFVQRDPEENPTFHPCPAPSETELLQVAQRVFKRMRRYLEQKGYLDQQREEEEMTKLDRWFAQAVHEPSLLTPTQTIEDNPVAVEHGGFSVHAGVNIEAGDHRGREQLCRYLLRPAFAEEQFSETEDGRIRFELRRPARSGQSVILLDPLQLLRRLAWLVPPPRQHQLRYAGVLAPAAALRREVVPKPAPKLQLVLPLDSFDPEPKIRRLKWKVLLAKVYDIDAERCPRCGSKVRAIGAVTARDNPLRHLAQMNQPRARAPPGQLELPLAPAS
jgi:hypothetical protein